MAKTDTEELTRLRAELDSWRERALAAEAWREEVWMPLQRRLQDAQRTESLAERATAVEQSLSWRLTRPLRFGLTLVRWISARLRLS